MDLLVNRFGRHLLAVAVLAGLFAAAFNAWHRTPWSDEGWFSSAAYNLATHGVMATTVIEPAGSGLTRIDQRTYWVMPLFLAGQALWLKVAPASLFGVRLFTLLWFPVVLRALYVLLVRLAASRGSALLACGLLATSYVYVDNAGFGRPDVPCAALGLGALAAYLSLREASLARAAFVSNACLAAAAMMHPNAIFHALALAFLMLRFDGVRVFRPAVLAAAAVPYAIAGAAWGAYISLDLAAFRDQMATNGTNGRWPADWNPVAILWSEIYDRYRVAFGLATRGLALLKVAALSAYLAAAAFLLLDRRMRLLPPVRIVLALCAIYFAAMSVFNQKLSYYLVHIVPFLVAGLAIAVAELWGRYPRARIALAVLVAALAALETGGVAVKAAQRSYRAGQKAMVSFVRGQLRESDRVAGSAALLFEFDFDTRLKDDPYLGTAGAPAPDFIVVEGLYRGVYEAWDTVRPDAMRLIRQRLSEYKPIYRAGEYEVYRREGR